jgi:drug/metabolite transporter (DMT)-like permease
MGDNSQMNAASLFATCVLIWGTTWYAITLQLAATSPAVGVALRFSLAAALIFLWCVARGHRLRLPRVAHAWLALMGLLNFFVSYLFVYYAEQRIVSGLVAVGYSAMPLLNMALSRLFFGTRMSGRVGLGGLLGVSGIALIFWPEFARFAADAPLLAGAAFTALAVLTSGLANMIVARNQSAGIDGWTALAYAMAYGALGTTSSSPATRCGSRGAAASSPPCSTWPRWARPWPSAPTSRCCARSDPPARHTSA